MQNNEFTNIDDINPTLSSKRLLYEFQDEERLETVRLHTDKNETHYIIREVIEPTKRYIPTLKYEEVDVYTNYSLTTALTNSMQVSEKEIQKASEEFYTWIESEIEKYLYGSATELLTNNIDFATQGRIFITVTDALIEQVSELLGIESITEPDKQILESILPNEILVEIDYRNNNF